SARASDGGQRQQRQPDQDPWAAIARVSAIEVHGTHGSVPRNETRGRRRGEAGHLMRARGDRTCEQHDDRDQQLNLADRPERAATRVRPRAQSPAKATVVMIAFSAWRESSRVCWTTIGTSDSITLA